MLHLHQRVYIAPSDRRAVLCSSMYIHNIPYRTYNFSNLPILARLEFLRLLSAAHPTIYTFYIAFCTHVRVALFYPLTTHVGGECEAARPSDWSNYWALITDTQTHTTSGYIEISCGAAHIVFITCSWGFFVLFCGVTYTPSWYPYTYFVPNGFFANWCRQCAGWCGKPASRGAREYEYIYLDAIYAPTKEQHLVDLCIRIHGAKHLVNTHSESLQYRPIQPSPKSHTVVFKTLWWCECDASLSSVALYTIYNNASRVHRRWSDAHSALTI